MHDSGEIASAGSMWLAAVLFVITYAVVMSERVNRAIVALVAAGLMIILGVLNQEAAIRGIDFNTIGLLIGMMVIVAITPRGRRRRPRRGGARGLGGPSR